MQANLFFPLLALVLGACAPIAPSLTKNDFNNASEDTSPGPDPVSIRQPLKTVLLSQTEFSEFQGTLEEPMATVEETAVSSFSQTGSAALDLGTTLPVEAYVVTDLSLSEISQTEGLEMSDLLAFAADFRTTTNEGEWEFHVREEIPEEVASAVLSHVVDIGFSYVERIETLRLDDGDSESEPTPETIPEVEDEETNSPSDPSEPQP